MQLALVASLEFGPPIWVVAKPSSERRRWCDLFQPLVDRRLLFAQPPRPEAIDEDAFAVRPRPGRVSSLDAHNASRRIAASVGGTASTGHFAASFFSRSCAAIMCAWNAGATLTTSAFTWGFWMEGRSVV